MLGLEAEEITTSARLEALAPAWTDLWQRAPAATPFQSPAWLIPWWRHCGQGDLLVLAARERGRLVGLLPLYVYREGALRKLLPLGIGVSDYGDALLDAEHPQRAARCLLGHLAHTAERWDVCDLQPLPATSTLLAAEAPDFAEEGRSWRPVRCCSCLARLPTCTALCPNACGRTSATTAGALSGRARCAARPRDPKAAPRCSRRSSPCTAPAGSSAAFRGCWRTMRSALFTPRPPRR